MHMDRVKSRNACIIDDTKKAFSVGVAGDVSKLQCTRRGMTTRARATWWWYSYIPPHAYTYEKREKSALTRRFAGRYQVYDRIDKPQEGSQRTRSVPGDSIDVCCWM